MESTDQLIEQLTADLKPVRRLWPPFVRTGLWLAVVGVIAIGLAVRADLEAIHDRLAAAPDMWLTVVGSVATMILSAVAAFQLCLPDRSGRWMLLPLPGIVVWLGFSGLGCLRPRLTNVIHPASGYEAVHGCLPFILGMSLPLALLLVVMFRRARPLRMEAVAVLGGLASAAGAASLLWFDHPFDASFVDLIVHTLGVIVVITCVRLVAKQL